MRWFVYAASRYTAVHPRDQAAKQEAERHHTSENVGSELGELANLAQQADHFVRPDDLENGLGVLLVQVLAQIGPLDRSQVHLGSEEKSGQQERGKGQRYDIDCSAANFRYDPHTPRATANRRSSQGR